MDASAKYIVERMLCDAQHLSDQGHLKPHQLSSIRSQLTPLLQSTPSARVSSPPAAAASPSSNAATISHPLSQLALGKVPPPPPSPAAAPASAPAPAPAIAQQAASAAPRRDLAKALWAFDASGGPDELRLRVDETVEILDRSDDNWWKGRTKDGREGLFPANYVEAVAGPASPPSYAASSVGAEKTSATPASRWKPPMAKWSSAGSSGNGGSNMSAVPPPPNPQQQQQQQQPTAPMYGGYALANPNEPVPAPGQAVMVHGPNGLQPYVPTEEERKKHEKYKKLGGKVGMAAASGAGFAIGAGLVRTIF